MSALRDQFLLRPGVVFLNHGSFGACPRPVFDVYRNWQMELELQPVEFIQRRLNTLLAEARETLGEYVGSPGDDLVYVTNATTAVNIVARSIDLEAGDEVLTTDHEYGAINRTWEFVCGRRGARLVKQQIPLPIETAEQAVEAVWAGVTGRTRILAISHITAPTAMILPVTELVRRAREAGIITVVDGAHAAGQIDLDLAEMGVDFYAGNCHKWMMAPKGAGFLYARREMQPLLEPLIGGRAAGDPSRSPFLTEHQYQGTRDSAAFLSVPEAIRFMDEHRWPSVRSTCHDLEVHARLAVSELTNLLPVTPDDPTWFSQMTTLPIPNCDASELKRRLLDEYSIEIPTTGLNGMLFLRLSVQGYNSREDIDLLMGALSVILPEVTRFRAS